VCFFLLILDNVPFVRLTTGSATALGPALLMSVFMASKVVGSRVVLCTDGCANEGLGQLDRSTASEFYLRLGETASSKACVPFLLFSLQILRLKKRPLLLVGSKELAISLRAGSDSSLGTRTYYSISINQDFNAGCQTATRQSNISM